MPPYLKAEMGKKDRFHHGSLKFYQYKLNIRSKWEQRQVKVHEPQEAEISLPFITIFSIQLPKKKRVVALPFPQKNPTCIASIAYLWYSVRYPLDLIHAISLICLSIEVCKLCIYSNEKFIQLSRIASNSWYW
jgi:hypothetical protein